jgi:formyltetrahydrofolate deformylase
MKDSVVLLIDCPDRKGLVARVSGLLYEHGANILHADQHQDHEQGLFFMRVEFALAGLDSLDQSSGGASMSATGDISLDAFRAAFAPLAAELNMRWKLASSARRPRVALFCSHLHCMDDLLHRWRTRELGCDIPVIASNHRAVENFTAFYGISFEHTPVTAATRTDVEARQIELL